MISKVSLYIKGIFYALMNKPVTKVVTKENVVVQPFTKQQIKHLEDVFKLPVFKEGMTLTEIANQTGKYEVVEFIKAWSARGGK